MTFVSFWLTSLSIIISRSNLFAPNGIISLFFMTNIPFVHTHTHTHTHHIFFIFSSDVHLGCFCVLVIINRAATNTEMHVSFQIIILSRMEYYSAMKRDGDLTQAIALVKLENTVLKWKKPITKEAITYCIHL